MANISGVGKSGGVPIGTPTNTSSVKPSKSFNDTLASKVKPQQSTSVQSTTNKSNVSASNSKSDLARLLEGRKPSPDKVVAAALKGTAFEKLPISAQKQVAEHLANDPRFAERFSRV